MAVAKKTTTKKAAAKPAAKKTAAKPAAKKPAAKPAAKKTTTTKPTVKKVSKEKTTGDILVTGNKKIGTLLKEFNKKFSYCLLGVFYPANGGLREFCRDEDLNKTIASVRTKNSPGSISINGNKKIKTLVKEFETMYGLHVMVGCIWKNGERIYTGGEWLEKTLSVYNDESKAEGCPKGRWR